MADSKRHLGRGLSYPLSVGPDGDFLKVRDSVDSVRSAISFLLHTRLGERVHQPLIGSRLLDFKHEPNSPVLRSLLQQEITQTLLQGEPRISNVTVKVETTPSDERVLMIQIAYIVIPANVPGNLVFPFFLTA